MLFFADIIFIFPYLYIVINPMYTFTNLIENYEKLFVKYCQIIMKLLWHYEIILVSGTFFAGLFSIDYGPFIVCIALLTLLRIMKNYL
jgi:hypothetical protein